MPTSKHSHKKKSTVDVVKTRPVRATPPTNQDEPEDLGKMTVFDVKLTRMELAHIRDLFNVKLPIDSAVSLSEALAESQSRQMVETKLWQKLSAVMRKAGVPLEDEAPDFIVMPTGPAPMGVFQIEATDNQLKDMIMTAISPDDKDTSDDECEED